MTDQDRQGRQGRQEMDRQGRDQMKTKGRGLYEAGVLSSLVLSATLMLAAGVGAFLSIPRAVIGGLSGGAIVLIASTMLATRDMHTFRTLLGGAKGRRSEQLRRWTSLKTTSVLLFLLIIVSVLTLMVALAARLGILTPPGTSTDHAHFVWTLLAALGVSVVLGVYLSMRVRLERQRSHDPSALAGLVTGAALALFGALVSGSILTPGFVERTDGVFLKLAGAVLLSAALFPARGLPTPYRIFMHDPTQVKGPVHYTKSKGVFMPVLMAFGLLTLLLLAYAVLGLDTIQAVDQVAQSIWVVALLVLVVVVMGASFLTALLLARREDRPMLYGRPKSQETRRMTLILATSLTASALFAGGALLVASGVALFGLAEHRWLDLAVVAIMAALGPIGFYKAARMRHIRRMEDRFPDFLRDIAASHKGGLTLSASVHVAAKGDYGDLTPAIARMADQLSWNVGFEEVFERFGRSVRTPIVERTVSLILEASRSGGSTVDVLQAASRDAREIKGLENQRRMNMTLYLAVIYMTFFVFLGVVSVLYSRFMPEIIEATAASQANGRTGVSALDTRTLSLFQYRNLYYLAAVVQAVGNGIIAGLMTTGRALYGLRHAFLMVFVSFAMFSFLLL